MPDVKDAEKKQIRSRATELVMNLLSSSISQGLIFYSKILDKLYDRSAKWKFCLHCGIIDTRENLTEETHSCAEGFERLPVIVITNWVRMKEFFLSDEYYKIMYELKKEISEKKVIIQQKAEEKIEEIIGDEKIKTEID